jgi:hypothetical protein
MDPESTNNNEAMRMDHEEASRMQACSRYLLGDLSLAEAEAFEEHFLACLQCAEELKAGAIFDENVRAVFHDQASSLAVVSPAEPRTGPGWLKRLHPAIWLPCSIAACCLLALSVYQNLRQIPGLKREIAALSDPQPVPQVPLKIAREQSPVRIQPAAHFWIAYFFLPNPAEYPSYICEIRNSGGSLLKTVTLPAPAPGDPFSILLRRSDFPGGIYSFKVHGQNSSIITSYTVDLETN